MELTLRIIKDGNFIEVNAYDALIGFVNAIPDEEIKGHFGADVKDRRRVINKYVDAISKDFNAVSAIQRYYDHDKCISQSAIINVYLYEVIGD